MGYHLPPPPADSNTIMKKFLLISLTITITILSVSAGPNKPNGNIRSFAKENVKKPLIHKPIENIKSKRGNSISGNKPKSTQNKNSPKSKRIQNPSRKDTMKKPSGRSQNGPISNGNKQLREPQKRKQLRKEDIVKQNNNGQKKKSGRTSNTKVQGRATVNDTCLDTSMQMLKIAKDKVTNFLMQYKRMTKFNTTAG